MVSEKQLMSWMEEEYLQFTNNPCDAIYLIPDGRCISAYDIYQDRNLMPERVLDHRCIEGLVDGDRYDDGFWGNALKETGFILVIPDQYTAIVSSGVEPTEEQIQNLREMHYQGFDIYKSSSNYLDQDTVYELPMPSKGLER